MSKELRESILAELTELSTPDVARVRDYIDTLRLAAKAKVSRDPWWKNLAGTIRPEILDQMAKAIEEDCERIEQAGRESAVGGGVR